MSDYEETMCRVCLQDYNEDYESVFADDNVNSGLSPLGLLYEELTLLPIQHAAGHPQYLCNYCMLQLKLFHKFKTKAVESHMLFTEVVAKESKTSVYALEYVPDKETEAVIKPVDSTIEIVDASTLELSPFNIDRDEEDRDDEEADDEEEEKITEEEEDDEVDNEFEDVQYLEDDIDESNIGELQDTHDNNEQAVKKLRPSTGIYPCKTCNQDFGRKIDLIKHRSEQHKRIKYYCSLCSKHFFEEELLDVHMRTHYGLAAYECLQCKKSFNHKALYEVHLKWHRNERNIQCHLCGKTFFTKNDLKIHIRVHNDERPYQCDVCDKRFRVHSHMAYHRFSHFDKRFECTICKRKYVSPATLRTHKQCYHDGKLQYKCATCNSAFKKKSNLNEHIKKHSKLITEECVNTC